MKHLELTEQKAKDLNELCQFAVEFALKNEYNSDNFDITYYQRQKPHYKIDYLRHLLDVAKQFPDVNKLLHIEGVRSVWATHNTKEFLKSDGFLRILKIEQRDDNIQDFTLTTLRQTALGTKEWLRLLGVTILVAVTTSLLTDNLSGKNSPQDTTQEPKQLQLDTSKLYQDFLNSYKDSLQRLKNDTAK
jgi:hypothetical protein